VKAYRCAGVLLSIALLLSGCSGEPPAPAPVTWTKVDLPQGIQPTLLSVQGDDLLVGGRRPGVRVVPQLIALTDDGRQTAVPLEPKSPYAFEATWTSVATDGRRIVAIGGAPGGAHSNTRWTVWTGTTAGLVEQPQRFETFGGWGAGALVEAVMTPAGSLLVGSWNSVLAGLDIALWQPSGTRWIRQDPAGTVLQSTADLQLGVRAGAASGDGLVLAGSQLKLSPGEVRQQAAVWRSTALNQGWRRLVLPDEGKISEALAVRCDGPVCVIAGHVDGKLALWRLDGDQASRVDGLPDIALGEKPELAAPIDVGGRTIQVVASNGKVVVVSGGTLKDSQGPAGPVADAAIAGKNLYVLAGDPVALWRADVDDVSSG